MASEPKDDLFENSTMTFGEHLEELRTSLFKAMIWLAVGVLLGFLVADRVVEAIKLPLENALEDYSRTKARKDLAQAYGGSVPPEMAALIDQEGLVPDKGVQVDPGKFFRQLKAQYPGQFDHLPDTSYLLTVDDIAREGLGPLCRSLAADGAGSKASPGKAVWRQLTSEERQRVESLGSRQEGATGQRQEVIRMFNRILDQPALHQSHEMKDLKFISDKDVKKTAKRIRERLSKEFDSLQSRRLNRLLLGAAYPEQIRRSQIHERLLRSCDIIC